MTNTRQKTRQLICKSNQLTVFYMRGSTLVVNRLKLNNELLIKTDNKIVEPYRTKQLFNGVLRNR